jgi:hypothetical protein
MYDGLAGINSEVVLLGLTLVCRTASLATASAFLWTRITLIREEIEAEAGRPEFQFRVHRHTRSSHRSVSTRHSVLDADSSHDVVRQYPEQGTRQCAA